jgi:methionine-rich copper-binding protein CopC
MTSGLFHRAATLGALLFLAVSVLPLGAPAQAQGAAPTITFQNPKDGDTLGEKPFVLQMCFSEPITSRTRVATSISTCTTSEPRPDY